MNTAKESDLVAVMVPRDRLLDVYSFLGKASSTAESKVQDSSGEHIPHNDRPVESKEWPSDLLARAYRESSPAMKAVLDVLIANAGTVIWSSELIEALARFHGRPCDSHTLAGTFGAFGRRVANRYGRKDWPLFSDWDDQRQLVWYRIAPEVAEQMR